MQQHQPRISPEHDKDFFAWTQHQAKLLRAARSALPSEVDLDHVAEEIEDLGKAELRGATSLIRQIMIHLIKAASESTSQARAHWRADATAFQADLPGLYSPSMRQLIDMQAIWRKALRVAEPSLQERGRSLSQTIPATCPYLLDGFLIEDFDFDAALRKLEH